MNKPWKSETGGAQLEAFIGAYGIHTSEFPSTEELIRAAARLYELDFGPETTVSQAAKAIDDLGKKERKLRAYRNRDTIASLPISIRGNPNEMAKAVSDRALRRMMDDARPQLIDGDDLDIDGQLDIDPAQLLRKVVSAVISAGRADILWEFPEVLAFFGSRIPYRHEVAHLHNIDERQFEAKARWPNVRPDPAT